MMRGLVVAAIIAAGGTAYAQSEKTAAAFAFKKGKELMNSGKIAEACAAFEQSQKLDPQLGTQYNLARCLEKQGKLASAWTQYTELAAKDSNAGRREDADHRAQSLEPKLTKMMIRVAKAPTGLAIALDGNDVTMLVGVESPIDAGMHTLVATAPNLPAWTAQVDFAGEGRTITVDVPVLGAPAKVDAGKATPAKVEPARATPAKVEPTTPPPTRVAITTTPRAAAEPAEPAPTGALPSSQDAAHDEVATSGGLTGVQKVGIGVVVGGGVAIVVGAVLRFDASQKESQAQALCGGPLDGPCIDPQRRADANAKLAEKDSLTTDSNIVLGVGAGVALAGGAMLLFGGAQDAPAGKPHTAFRPVVAPDRVGFALSGSF